MDAFDIIVHPQVGMDGPQRLQSVVDVRKWFPPAFIDNRHEILVWEHESSDQRRLCQKRVQFLELRSGRAQRDQSSVE